MLGIFQGEPLLKKFMKLDDNNWDFKFTYTIHNAFLNNAGNIDAGSVLGG